MTPEARALSQSTGWLNGMHGLYGYLPFSAAQTLVASGKYAYHQVAPWGYIVQARSNA